jgi:hypothetical protein
MTVKEMRNKVSKTNLFKIDAMTDKDIARVIAADPDAYELTDQNLVKLRPASETHP